MPAVSVLMPCYNVAETLAEALESLAAQTLVDFEIVAVDDGSDDATPALLQAWARRDSRLRLLSLPHGGIIPGLNAGLAACRAEYVARMDADDRCHPQRLELQAAYLDAHPEVTLAACRVRGFPPETLRPGGQKYLAWLNSLLSGEDILRELYVESPFAHPSVLFRRSAVLQAGGYQDHGWAEDYDLWLRLAQAGAQFAKLPQVLFDWRDHAQRLTHRDERYTLENFRRARAHYLLRGPLAGRDALILWGAGRQGRRLGRLLLQFGAPLVAYIDIDPDKIGNTRHARPILPPEELLPCWGRYRNPVLLVTVGVHGALQIVRKRLNGFGLLEGRDWWGAA